MEELTLKQQEILQTIKKFVAENGYPPTVRELGEELKIASTATIHFHIKHLVTKGYIQKGTKNRDLKLLVPNEFVDQTNDIVHVPFLTRDTKDIIKNIQTPQQFFPLPIGLLGNKNNSFVLQVKNQQMSNYGICDNDMLIVEKKVTANHGDIIVLLSKEQQIYVKKHIKEGDKSYFQDDQAVPLVIQDFIILGKVIGLYRTF